MFRPVCALAISLMAMAAPAAQAQTASSQTSSIATAEQVSILLESGDDARAFAQAKAGADAQNAELTGYLGWFYDNGRHVESSPAQAAALYRTAADLGDAYSQWRIAVMIDEGIAEGTLEEAITFLRKAAGQKNSGAMVSLAVMHANGRGVTQDHVAALRYYQAAARLGHAQGLLGIGIQHANGEGVERNMRQAIAHWIVAAAQGEKTADALLGKHLDTVSEDEALAAFQQADVLAQKYGVAIRFELAETDIASEGR